MGCATRCKLMEQFVSYKSKITKVSVKILEIVGMILSEKDKVISENISNFPNSIYFILDCWLAARPDCVQFEFVWVTIHVYFLCLWIVLIWICWFAWLLGASIGELMECTICVFVCTHVYLHFGICVFVNSPGLDLLLGLVGGSKYRWVDGMVCQCGS